MMMKLGEEYIQELFVIIQLKHYLLVYFPNH